MAYYTCDDCAHYDPDDVNRYGECFCTHYCKYYPKSDPACKYFDRKSDCNLRSNCFLTTAMCNIFGFEDDCYGLNVMRDFRDTILIADRKYYPLLAEYEVVGPIISNELYNDSYREEVAGYYFENYIYDIIINLTTVKNYEEAVNKYVEMVNDMKRMYGVTKEVTDDEVKILSKKIENKQYKNKAKN